MENNKEITQVDLNRIITEETAKFLRENRSEIIKRAHSRLRAEVSEEKKRKDA